jgi:transcriptional regulator with XRE-family HTH domain
MNVMTASEKIASLKAAGLSGVEIAKETGISQPTISRIERGIHSEPKETAVRAIDALYSRVMAQENAA